MPDRIDALHPDPEKQGTTIDAAKYHTVREAIEAELADGPVALAELRSGLKRRIGDTFDGSVSWYMMAVKLDLEARNVIERVPGQTPQHVRLVG
ncbi:DUF6958 family protein [Rubrivirga sp. IMCC43871]|uniref:DUF6958 family protein n=1 Tax=Rubrivirga sp. IMCC43871 TaxID=3391575 RepID=UPI00398F9BBC